MCLKSTTEAPAGIRHRYIPPWCCMWLKKVCAEEIICEREREGGGFWKLLFGALGASECHSCGVISRCVLECTAVALKWSPEVKPVQKLHPHSRLMRYILSGLYDRVAPFVCCYWTVHSHAVRSNYDTSTELAAGYGFCHRFMAATPHPISLSLTVNNTIICLESQAKPVRLNWALVCRWIIRLTLSSEADLCSRLFF